MATKKSTKNAAEQDSAAKKDDAQQSAAEEKSPPTETIAEKLRKLCDRTTGKMMRLWFQAECEGQADQNMLEAIKNLANAKKSFLAGSSGKKSLITYLDRIHSKIGMIKDAQPHLIAIRKIIEDARGMPADEFARLIDEIRGHWLQEGPLAD